MENRIIKFRAFNNDRMGESFNPFDPEFLIGGGTFQRGTIFMQFTGLLDKNGKEIYEGDIISSKFSDGDDCNHVIEYKESSFIVRYYADGLDVGSGFTQKWINEYGKEIIGNIYSNPDLIK